MSSQFAMVAPEPADGSDLRSKQAADGKTRSEVGNTAVRELGRKKRTNRSAKLKQCKLDAKREQWLSQVRDKGQRDVNCGSSPSSERSGSPDNFDNRHATDGLEFHDNDVGSPLTSSESRVVGNIHSVSGQERPGTSSSSTSFSGSADVSDDDGSFDDWEAIADALGMDDLRKPPSEPSVGEGAIADPLPEHRDLLRNSTCYSSEVASKGILRPEYKGKSSCFEKNQIDRATACRAWRPDDAARPPSLPTLTKQMSFPAQSERHSSRGSINWGSIGIVSQQPSNCPICYEDLDLTDSSFLPCSCGFRLCLFCHKRILEVDGRCPGCRKHYVPVDEHIRTSVPPIWLSRSCSMQMRS
ncbi:uncharacterized protein LOC116250823 [Nymphaea colorata]|nr:uncharacterized protein LOC116250823 [Nymphaea colorata]